MFSVLGACLNAVNWGFEPRIGKTKNYKIVLSTEVLDNVVSSLEQYYNYFYLY